MSKVGIMIIIPEMTICTKNAYFYFLFCFGLVQWVEVGVEDHFVALLEAEEKDLVRFAFLEISEF